MRPFLRKRFFRFLKQFHGLRFGFGLAALLLVGSTASAQSPIESALPSPVIIQAPQTARPNASMSISDTMQLNEMTVDEGVMDTIPPTQYDSSELPASMTNPSGILPLAIDGQFAFEPLPARGDVCNRRPIVSCLGPDYCGCHPRIYYGTNPCDDDPVLTMSPTVCDGKTTHWYQHAFRMVTRKKAVTEAIK
jgi:hypothetical protein